MIQRKKFYDLQLSQANYAIKIQPSGITLTEIKYQI